jgi:DNA-directed RNA polymerase subunit L
MYISIYLNIMNYAKLTHLSEDHELMKFTLSNINVSLANAIRRTILNDIPTVVLGTEIYQDKKCVIEINTGRLHNELVKQRLSCIPVHITSEKEIESFPEKYILVVDVKNDTDVIKIVTTEDFRIKLKDGDKFLSVDEVRSIFPPDIKTRDYIDFVRLRPRIGDSIPGEHIKLTCEFSIATANENGSYNVVSKSTYGNTIDIDKGNEAWDEKQQKLAEENTSKEEMAFYKRNFYILDAQRFYVNDSFDFQIQSIGVFDNKYIIKKACYILRNYFLIMHKNLESDVIPINTSLSTMENAYDITLMDADYTVGKAIEFLLYDKYYNGQEILSFCGFKKVHPHDSDSIIRLSYKEPTEKHILKQHLRDVCAIAAEFYDNIDKMF